MLDFKLVKSFFHLYFLRRNIPLFVNLSVTDRCNFRCSHCKIPERNSKELTKEDIFSIVDDLHRLGTKKIGLCGGEPLMREDIGEIVNYIKSKHILVTIVSNGALVRQRIKEIKNLDLIIISFDGSPHAQEEVRGKHAYEIAIDAIEAAREHHLKVVSQTTFTKNNIKELEYILKMAESMGFTCLFLPVYHYAMSGEFVKTLFPDREEFRHTIERIEKIKKSRKAHLITNSVVGLNYLKAWPKFTKVPCWAGKSYAYIDTDGQIYPCIQMIQRTEGVSLLEVGIEEAMKKMTRLPCPGCWCIPNIEHNYFFSFNLGMWLHYYKLAKMVNK